MDKTTKDTGTGVPATTQEAAPALPEIIRYTADAQERIARQRLMWAEFPVDPDARPLSTGEMAVARRLPAAALEKTVVMAEALPDIGVLFPDLPLVRDAIAFELAYAGVRDEARAFARRVDMAILWKKHKAGKAVHGFYRMSKTLTTVDAGDPFKPHVADMRRLLTSRRKPTPAPEGETTPTKQQ